MPNDQMTAKIKAALAKLDPANNDHWTDEGIPKTGVVQRLASDQTIKRSDIQAVAPDFVRSHPAEPIEPVNPVAATPVEEFGDDPVEHTGGTQGGTPAEAPLKAAEPLTPDDGATDETALTDDEFHMLLQQRVDDYDQAVKDARATQAKAAKDEIEALKALNEAKKELNAAFPPKTAAENIKEYLASEQAKRAAAHGHTTARVDQAMARGNARGWRRPVRGVTGADGNLIKNPDGSIAIPRAMQVRPRAVLPSQGTRA